MQFSAFGEKFTQHSGILQLMDDLGDALKSDKPVNMLGGGNPARIAEVNAVFADVFSKLAAEHAVENIGNYSNPQGDAALIDALTAFLNREYGWNLTADNIALTNGSQNAFFYLFNLFGGKFKVSDDLSVEKAILLPLAPEYIGYADVHVEGQHFVSVKPKIEAVEHEGEAGFFKYRVDFDALESLPELKAGKIGAICCSRPTNPTGNVLTDGEMARLDALAQAHGIPLIIDNAYGMPFPNIIYSDVTLNWHENINPLLQPFQSRLTERAHRHHRRRAGSGQSRQQSERDCEPVAYPLRRSHCNAAVAGRSSETAFRRRHPAVLPQSGTNCRLAAQARAGRISAENPQARRRDFPVALV